MFIVRKATSADVTSVDALLARAYPILLEPNYPADVLRQCLPAISRAQPELVTCGTYFVVEEGGQLIGAGGWTPEAPGTGVTVTGVGHIRHVVTDDRAVRRGVGRCLLRHIFENACESGVTTLGCLSTLTAETFYKAMGFEKVALIDVPLPNGSMFPAIEMSHLTFCNKKGPPKGDP